MAPVVDLGLDALQHAFADGSITPTQLLQQLYGSWQSASVVFTYLAPLKQLLEQAEGLSAIPASSRGKLWGVPCAIKDNIDVAGMPTTAACPSFAYTPGASSPSVRALHEAGAIIVGKTNMDQFAAGLVGTRSPFGAPSSPFDPRFISGGSSSGSGAAVGAGLLSFALGTDTAGSGRVPAGLCGCVGIKGTVGSVSTVGVVPAAASLDCVTVFARSVQDGAAVMQVMRSAHAGAQDVWRRRAPCSQQQVQPPVHGFRFAIPPLSLSDWSGPGGDVAAHAAAQAFAAAVKQLETVGGVQVEIDWTPLSNVAAMLYGTALVAERYSGIRPFLTQRLPPSQQQGTANSNGADINGAAAGQVVMGSSTPSGNHGDNGDNGGDGMCSSGLPPPVKGTPVSADPRLLRVTRTIIAAAESYSAADVYDAQATLAQHRAAAQAQLQAVDLLLVPTALHHYTIQEVLEEEAHSSKHPRWTRNANLGRFTNFVNLLDMCGCALPSSTVVLDYSSSSSCQEAAGADDEPAHARAAHLRATGSTKVVLPFGVTLLARAWQDEWVWQVAAALQAITGLGCGPAGHVAVAAA